MSASHRQETARAATAWSDYLALGPARSLEKLHQLYVDRHQTGAGAAPTIRINTLKDWSVAFGWQDRLRAIAEEEARRAEAREAAHRREVMETGYATVEGRVRLLKHALTLLVTDLGVDPDTPSDPNFWISDVKGIGSGEHFREVPVERFNTAQIEALRGLLDDVARETGGRVRRNELLGKDGGPVRAEVVIHMPDNGRGTVQQ